MEEMTPRERLLTALNMGEPDRVPVSPRIFTGIASKVLSLSINDIESPLATYPLWRAELETYRNLGMDAWVDALGVSLRSAPKVKTHLKIVKKEGEKMWINRIYETPRGILSEQIYCPGNDHPWTTEYLVKDIYEDLGKAEYLYQTTMGVDFSEYDKAKNLLGDDGISSVWLSSPLVVWVGLRELTESVRDFFIHPDILVDFFNSYERYLLNLLIKCLEHQVDLILYDGWADGLSLFNPDIFRKYAFPRLKKAANLARKYDVPIGYYISGPIKPLLGMIKESRISCLMPLEPPEAKGDVDLGEIKETVGNDICLRGNFYLPIGTTAEAEKITRNCINQAAYGGGYVFATADTCDDVTLENVITFVKTAKRYGKYPIRD